MIISGIGIDIIDVRRIARLVKDDNFVKKIYTPEEIKYCRAKKKSPEHFAVRFAAKEAVWKAVGKKDLSLKKISIVNTSDGKPEVRIQDRRFLEDKIQLFISLSHTQKYAAAFCIATVKK